MAALSLAEAAPDPPHAANGQQRQRHYCPVLACPCSDRMRAPGWASIASMQPHLNAHLSGALAGQVPSDWLRQHGKTTC
eukprot:4532489-Alexandrium_andersonii.AAC.1